MAKDVLGMVDVQEVLPILLEQAARLKEWNQQGQLYQPLAGRTLGMIFEKASTRTRVSFEVGMAQLGGRSIVLGTKDIQMGRGETTADTARVLSRYLDGLMYRAFRYQDVATLAANATIPVINGLDDREHPCQALADLQTIREHKGTDLSKVTLAYVGDGNNVCNSLLLASAMVGMSMRVGCPEGARYQPNAEILATARRIASGTGAHLEVLHDAKAAVSEADVLYTDTWVSMGDEAEAVARKAAFAGFCLDEVLLANARHDAIVLHCLPAHRGEEITDAVMDGPQSVVWDQAENRLHAQKALLVYLLGG